ncbi:MAG: hypothetical protein RLZZ127_10, partial [Planctomycetota bacterium]
MANDDRTDEGQAAPDWKGAEQTSVGPASPATPPPAVPWTGGEGTMVGMPTPPRPGIPAGAVPWTGGEQTLAGMPAPGAAPAGAAPWTGGEQTLAGMPAGAAPAGEAGWAGTEATAVGGAAAPADPSRPATDPARKLGKTTATMDDGWHLKGRKGPMTGQTFGDYDIGGVLGEGGMGVVYRARQVSLKRRVALKVLPPALANDTRLLQRFEQEARTASLLNTPHVVQVFAAGTVDGTSFFAMEFVEGTDLSEIIKAKDAKGERFATEEAADYIIQAARGLAEAGKLGIVHRDIKPANLMVTSKGLVKVADFGISKVAGEHSLTMTGTAVGTPAYCSPEQGRGDAVDHRSDIYSLGVVLYELLTGRKPFDGATANALIYQHNYAEPTLLREIRADLSEEYQAIALKCLQKDPANRYQDAADLVGDLERVRAGSAPMTALMSAFGTGADEAMRRLGIKQRRVWPWIAAATVAILGAGGAYWWWQAGEQERAVARDERTRLREKLAAVIDKPVPVDASVPVDLRAYAGLVGDGDEDVVRWSAEIVGIQAAERDLAVLDREELPGAASRAALAARLLDHARWVGTAGQDHQRWTARLAQVDGRIADLRRTLAGTFDG